jgi:predicted RNase H-like HicB family nuclease
VLYPVYIHAGDDAHAHGATVPDFPGCFSAADGLDELPAKVREAVELYCQDADFEIPSPSPLGELVSSPEYTGGTWIMVEIDLERLR